MDKPLLDNASEIREKRRTLLKKKHRPGPPKPSAEPSQLIDYIWARLKKGVVTRHNLVVRCKDSDCVGACLSIELKLFNDGFATSIWLFKQDDWLEPEFSLDYVL